MKEYICKEVPTDNGGYLEAETELIRCKNCVKRKKNKYCLQHKKYRQDEGYCDDAKPRENENEMSV